MDLRDLSDKAFVHPSTTNGRKEKVDHEAIGVPSVIGKAYGPPSPPMPIVLNGESLISGIYLRRRHVQHGGTDEYSRL